MTIDQKNNPDGQGSYGKSPSQFVPRPKDSKKASIPPNDATAAPMGHTGEDQKVFDEIQRKKATPQSTAGDPFTTKPAP